MKPRPRFRGSSTCRRRPPSPVLGGQGPAHMTRGHTQVRPHHPAPFSASWGPGPAQCSESPRAAVRSSTLAPMLVSPFTGSHLLLPESPSSPIASGPLHCLHQCHGAHPALLPSQAPQPAFPTSGSATPPAPLTSTLDLSPLKCSPGTLCNSSHPTANLSFPFAFTSDNATCIYFLCKTAFSWKRGELFILVWLVPTSCLIHSRCCRLLVV